jgi:hypothetical protein
MFLCYKSGKKLGKDFYLKKGKKKNQTCKVSKINIARKGKLENCIQKKL